eukprot:1061739-Pyramimonas_sp.AAC.2
MCGSRGSHPAPFVVTHGGASLGQGIEFCSRGANADKGLAFSASKLVGRSTSCGAVAGAACENQKFSVSTASLAINGPPSLVLPWCLVQASRLQVNASPK